MNWSDAEIWVLLALALSIAEIFVAGFVLACLAAGAGIAAVSAALGWGFSGQILTASAASTLAFVFLRPVAQRWFFSRIETKTGVDALSGRTAFVTQAFDPQTRLGRCKVDGDDWLALWLGDGAFPALGDRVHIHSVDSNILQIKHLPT